MALGILRLRKDNIEKWLSLNAWTKQQLAEEMHRSPEALSLLLNGKRFPRRDTLEDLCRITGLDVGTLLTFERNGERTEPVKED